MCLHIKQIYDHDGISNQKGKALLVTNVEDKNPLGKVTIKN